MLHRFHKVAKDGSVFYIGMLVQVAWWCCSIA